MSGALVDVVVVGLPETRERIDEAAPRLREALLPRVTELAIRLREKVQDEKLTGQVLHVRTGNLRRSIFFDVQDLGDAGVVGEVKQAGDVRYGRIHEFGGVINHPGGTAYAMTAEGVRFVSNAKAEALKILGRTGPHTITMPERSFMRSSLAEMRAEIVAGLRSAALEALGQPA